VLKVEGATTTTAAAATSTTTFPKKSECYTMVLASRWLQYIKKAVQHIPVSPTNNLAH